MLSFLQRTEDDDERCYLISPSSHMHTIRDAQCKARNRLDDKRRVKAQDKMCAKIYRDMGRQVCSEMCKFQHAEKTCRLDGNKRVLTTTSRQMFGNRLCPICGVADLTDENRWFNATRDLQQVFRKVSRRPLTNCPVVTTL